MNERAKNELHHLGEDLIHFEHKVKERAPSFLRIVFDDVVADLKSEGDIPLANIVKGVESLTDPKQRIRAREDVAMLLHLETKRGVKAALTAVEKHIAAYVAAIEQPSETPAQPDPKEAVHQ